MDYLNYRKIKGWTNLSIEGFKNIIYFLPAIWRFRSWDFGYTYELLYLALVKVRDRVEDNPIVRYTPKEIQRIRDCVYLLNRVNKDDYFTNDEVTSRALINSEYMRKRDTEYLFKLISKYGDTWWD